MWWRYLRSTRVSPPEPATRSEDRRRTYVSALEQAEQLFTAAEGVGPASRPLLLFYGLSQAGRALAAAGRARGVGWHLRSHGLSAPDLTRPLVDLPILQTGLPDGSFVALSRILGSPSIPGRFDSQPLTLGEVWTTIPEVQGWPLEERAATPMLFWENKHSDTHRLASGLLNDIPRWLLIDSGRDVAFRDFMSHYPHAADYTMVHMPENPNWPDFETGSLGKISLVMHWDTGKPMATQADREQRLRSVMTQYNVSTYLIPAVAGNDRPLHPLMSWWALLYALSMLSRYQPTEWLNHINVNSSPHAVALESLLDTALDAVPRLIYSTIMEMS